MPRGLPQCPSGRYPGVPGHPTAAQFCLRGHPLARAQQSPHQSPSPSTASQLRPLCFGAYWFIYLRCPTFLASCQHAITPHQMWDAFDIYYLCATRKERVMPRNPRHAAECEMRPNFQDIKCGEKCIFTVSEIWSLLCRVRLPEGGCWPK